MRRQKFRKEKKDKKSVKKEIHGTAQKKMEDWIVAKLKRKRSAGRSTSSAPRPGIGLPAEAMPIWMAMLLERVRWWTDLRQGKT